MLLGMSVARDVSKLLVSVARDVSNISLCC